VQYRAPKGSCAACPFREQCSPSGRERTIHRSWGQEFVETTEAPLASSLGKQRPVERKVFIEGAFGLAKELHGLRITRFKGSWRVQIQVWLTAAAMNIKKAVRRMVQRRHPAAPPQLLPRLQTWWLSKATNTTNRPDLSPSATAPVRWCASEHALNHHFSSRRRLCPDLCIAARKA
jgi:hypothetical protein